MEVVILVAVYTAWIFLWCNPYVGVSCMQYMLLLYIVRLLILVVNCNDGICFMCFTHCLAIKLHIP
jgi:hypothetical protein